jgi:hypothetical protein
MMGYGAAVIAGLAWYLVETQFGPIGGTRFFGALFLLFAAWGIWAPSIAVLVGNYQVTSLSGWEKAFVLIPAAVIGVMLMLYAPEITCMGTRHRHLCH